MWLFTTYGFFSVVCATNRKTGEPDKNLLMVCVRDINHLTNLTTRFPGLSAEKPVATKNTDYPWRMFVSKKLWQAAVKEMTAEMDYSNFKDECEMIVGSRAAYIDVLHEVWEVTRQLQRKM